MKYTIPSKITESVICDSIDDHLDKVIQRNQWGFRKGFLTNSILLHITEMWKRNLDKGNVFGTVLIDFKKAFDSVDHSILSSKMDACGLHGKLKDWIQSYLVDRKRFVVIKGKRSGLQIVPYDVPQGSLLRPKLFLIFVNDLPDCLSNGEIHLYSDDTTAIVIGKNEDEVVTLLNIIFSEISTWCSTNNLKIHPTKCKVMLISRKRFTGPLKPVKWETNV